MKWALAESICASLKIETFLNIISWGGHFSKNFFENFKNKKSKLITRYEGYNYW